MFRQKNKSKTDKKQQSLTGSTSKARLTTKATRPNRRAQKRVAHVVTSTSSKSFSSEVPQVSAIQSKLKRPDLFQTDAFINGNFVPAKSKKYINVIDPGNMQILGKVAYADSEDATEAIDGAFAVQKAWSLLPTHERCTIVTKWGQLMLENQEDLALIVSMEVGKPLIEARGEIAYAASFLDFYGKHGNELMRGETLHKATKEFPTHIVLEKVATGVAASPLPWNLPVAMATRKAGPALVAGCSMVLKPAENTPFSTLALALLAKEAGIPDGILQVISGNAPAIGTEITTNHKVRKVTFTGSTKTGALLMKQSADQIKNITMELGGNAPFIVYNDADIALALSHAVTAKTRNCGQTCVTPNRFLVESDVYDTFAEGVAERFSKLKVGYGLDEGTQVGPLINEAAVQKVEKQVADAVSKGAVILTGGKRMTIKSSNGESNLFFEPTVLKNCTIDMECFQHETFGPILPIFKFHGQNEALQLANNTDAGLAAYVFTADSDNQRSTVRGLEYGMVAVNQGSVSTAVAPFGGMKTSGIGREGSRFGIDAYYELKAVHYFEPLQKQ